MRAAIRLALGVLGLAGLFGAALLMRPVPVTGSPPEEPEAPRISATVRVAARQPAILFDLTEGQADYSTYLATQVALLRSRYVLNRALMDPKLAPLAIIRQQDDPAEWLSKDLEVTSSEDSELVVISMKTGTPQERATIINAVVNAYMKDVVEREHEDRLQRLQYLEKLYTKYQDNLKNSRNSLRQLVESAGSGGEASEFRKRMISDSLSMLEKARIELRLEQVAAEVMVGRRKGTPEAGPLEDRLAVLTAQREALDEDRRQLLEEFRAIGAQTLDFQAEQDQMALEARTAEKIGGEIEALKVELNAPKRVEVIDQAQVGPER